MGRHIQRMSIRTAVTAPVNQHSISLKHYRDYLFHAGIEPAGDELEQALSTAIRSNADASRNFIQARRAA